MLNASKGPAVRGPRAQMDRVLYKREVQRLLAAVPRLQVHDGAVVDLLVEQRPRGGDGGPAVAGVVLAGGERILCRSVVITTGTFLRGVVHVGSQSRPAGRIASLIAAREAARPEAAAAAVQSAEMTDRADEVAAGAATALARRFADLGFALGRLKTGTPPRLDGEPCRLSMAAFWGQAGRSSLSPA
jgi:tRNA uridine 5-carboxymethylaminomethyl modification enzyme